MQSHIYGLHDAAKQLTAELPETVDAWIIHRSMNLLCLFWSPLGVGCHGFSLWLRTKSVHESSRDPLVTSNRNCTQSNLAKRELVGLVTRSPGVELPSETPGTTTWSACFCTFPPPTSKRSPLSGCWLLLLLGSMWWWLGGWGKMKGGEGHAHRQFWVSNIPNHLGGRRASHSPNLYKL